MFLWKHLSSSRWTPSFFMNLPLFDCCLQCRGSRNHHRPVCIYSPHIVSRFPFCLWLCSFRFCDSAAHLLVCRAREVAGMAASFIHVLPRLPFCLWLKLYSSCESAVAPFPCLPCGKVLATVIGIRCESAIWGNGEQRFSSVQGAFPFFWFFWSVLPFQGV